MLLCVDRTNTCVIRQIHQGDSNQSTSSSLTRHLSTISNRFRTVLSLTAWTSALLNNGSFCDNMHCINGEIGLVIAGTAAAYLVSYQARTSLWCCYCCVSFDVFGSLVVWWCVFFCEKCMLACRCLTVSNAVMFLNEELRAVHAHSALDPRFV